MSETIKVVVRVRPMNSKERDRNCKSIVKIDQERNQISMTKPDQAENVKNFAYDSVFGPDSLQEIVYSRTAFNLVQNVLTGYNGTVFAYGQTGCGKTHSMVGRVDVEELQGIIPRSFGHILQSISESKDKEFLIRCSFLEIYNEQVRDLLGRDVKAKLEIKESPDEGVFIKDLSKNVAKTHDDLMEFMNIGNRNRMVGETAMNKESSRSHLIFSLFLESANLTDGDQEKKYVASKLNLVDLAGSERLSKTGAAGDRLKEAQKINLSLSALGNVISALVDGKSQHIPYRDSKLTRLLQDSLGGNTKTVMIANCSPADYNFDETLSTLRYASRAKFIKNKPVINEDPKDALLKEYTSEIKKLKMMLEGKELPSLSPLASGNTLEMDTRLKQKEEELMNEKKEKELYLQKIRELEQIHLEAKDVHVTKRIKETVARSSLINHQDQKAAHIKSDHQIVEQEVAKLSTEENTTVIKNKYQNLVKKLNTKIRNLQIQIKDINHENYMDKEILLQDIRDLTKENKLLTGVLNIMLQPTEIDTIKAAAEYSEEREEYRVPPFYMKNKQLVFPKMQINQSLDMIKKTQEDRVLEWRCGRESKQNHYEPSLQSLQSSAKTIEKKKSEILDYRVNGILKNARTVVDLEPVTREQKKLSRKMHLEPLRK